MSERGKKERRKGRREKKYRFGMETKMSFSPAPGVGGGGGCCFWWFRRERKKEVRKEKKGEKGKRFRLSSSSRGKNLTASCDAGKKKRNDLFIRGLTILVRGLTGSLAFSARFLRAIHRRLTKGHHGEESEQEGEEVGHTGVCFWKLEMELVFFRFFVIRSSIPILASRDPPEGPHSTPQIACDAEDIKATISERKIEKKRKRTHLCGSGRRRRKRRRSGGRERRQRKKGSDV